MHIGVLTHNYPRFSGDFSGNFVEALCLEMTRQQQQVTVWAPYDPAYNRPLDRPVRLQLYRYAWPDPLHRLGYMRSMQADLALRLESYLWSPALFGAGIAKVMRDAKRLRPDLLHAHWLLPNGFIGAVVSRRLGIPLVISVPGSDAQVAGQNALFGAMARFAFAQASLLTANSAALRDVVLGLGADASKFDLIIYGTDPSSLQPNEEGVDELRQRLSIEVDSVILLCVGRMAPKKGFDVLLQAMAGPILQSRNIVAVMVGTGDKWEEWQQLGRDLALAKRLRWVGRVPTDDIGVYYNLADMLVMPSVTKPADGLNVCVLDAMSCARPVVGSLVAGNPLAIRDGETGYLVPEQDAHALAQAIARLVDDRALRTQLGRAGRRRVEEELGWPALTRRYVTHFQRIVAG